MKCQCTTIKGTRCSRNAKAGSKYCWQHRNCKSPKTKTTKSPAVVRSGSKSPSRNALLVKRSASPRVSAKRLSQEQVLDLTNVPLPALQTILLELDDASLGQACRSQKRVNSICMQDNFWYLRSQRYLGNQLEQKRERESWRQFYQRVRAKPVYILRTESKWLGSTEVHGIFDSPVNAVKGLYQLIGRLRMGNPAAFIDVNPMNYKDILQHLDEAFIGETFKIDTLPVGNTDMSAAKTVLTFDALGRTITADPDFYQLPTYRGDGSGYIAIILKGLSYGNIEAVLTFPSLQAAIEYRNRANARGRDDPNSIWENIYWYYLNGVPTARKMGDIITKSYLFQITPEGKKEMLHDKE